MQFVATPSRLRAAATQRALHGRSSASKQPQDPDIDLVRNFLDSLPKNKLAQAAFNSKSYARGLMYMEDHLRQYRKDMQCALGFLQVGRGDEGREGEGRRGGRRGRKGRGEEGREGQEETEEGGEGRGEERTQREGRRGERREGKGGEEGRRGGRRGEGRGEERIGRRGRRGQGGGRGGEGRGEGE